MLTEGESLQSHTKLFLHLKYFTGVPYIWRVAFSLVAFISFESVEEFAYHVLRDIIFLGFLR